MRRRLETLYGRGFGEKNLRRMVQFATVFPEADTVAALRRQLSWAHFKLLIPLKDSLRRESYAEMCRVEGWSTRLLAQKIDAMQRLVAIELKIGDFKPGHSGQMELYLRWLDRHERQPSEQPPLGIILCAGKKRETVEYLDLDARGIHVAEYLTELPPREVLAERLHRAIEAARNRLVLGTDVDVVTDVTPTRTPTPRRKRRKQ